MSQSTYTFERALVLLMRATSAVVAQIGDRFFDRFFGQDITYPCAAFTIVDRRDEPHFRGITPTHRVQVQIDTYGTNADQCRFAASAIRDAMRTMPGKSWGEVRVHSVFKETDMDTSEGEQEGTGLPYFRNIQRWSAWITEPLTVTT